jgi:hypothetical protein
MTGKIKKLTTYNSLWQFVRNILTQEGRQDLKERKAYDRAFSAFSIALQPFSNEIPAGAPESTVLMDNVWMRWPQKSGSFTELMGKLEVQRLDDNTLVVISIHTEQNYILTGNSISDTIVKHIDHVTIHPTERYIDLLSSEGRKHSIQGAFDLNSMEAAEPERVESLICKTRALARITRLLHLAEKQRNKEKGVR